MIVIKYKKTKIFRINFSAVPVNCTVNLKTFGRKNRVVNMPTEWHICICKVAIRQTRIFKQIHALRMEISMLDQAANPINI